MSNYVALIRGINVGGRNSLPMKELTDILQGIGCDCVKTYIQSGNVVFTAAPPRHDWPMTDRNWKTATRIMSLLQE